MALVTQSAWACVLCLSGTYSQLLEYMVFASLLFYVLTACALFALRTRHPNLARPVRVIAYPWLPGFFLLFTAALALLIYTAGARLWDRRVGLTAALIILTNYLFFRLVIYTTSESPTMPM